MAEVAEVLGVHRNTVTDMIEAGAIRARRAGTKWIVPKSAMQEFLDGRDKPARVYSAQEIADVLALHVNTVAKLLQDGTIRARKLGKNWKIPLSSLEEYLQGRDN